MHLRSHPEKNVCFFLSALCNDFSWVELFWLQKNHMKDRIGTMTMYDKDDF